MRRLKEQHGTNHHIVIYDPTSAWRLQANMIKMVLLELQEVDENTCLQLYFCGCVFVACVYIPVWLDSF